MVARHSRERKPPTATVSSTSTTCGTTPARSNARSAIRPGRRACGPKCGSVSGSRWSVCPCVASTTSTKPSRAGVDDASRHAHVRLVASPRTSPSASPRGTGRRAGSGRRASRGSRSGRATTAQSPAAASTSARNASSASAGSITARRPDGRATPATRFASFCRAAQRAVCERPQSVREDEPLGRGELRKRRTRARDLVGRLDPVALHVDDADGHVEALGDLRRRSRSRRTRGSPSRRGSRRR